jgi:hypothetical protein
MLSLVREKLAWSCSPCSLTHDAEAELQSSRRKKRTEDLGKPDHPQTGFLDTRLELMLEGPQCES